MAGARTAARGDRGGLSHPSHTAATTRITLTRSRAHLPSAVLRTRRAWAGIRCNCHAAALRGRAADADAVLPRARRERVGAQAVDAYLVVIVAEWNVARGPCDEPVAARAVLERCAVGLGHRFVRRHHGPAVFHHRVHGIAGVIRRCRARARRRGCNGREYEGGEPYAERRIPHGAGCLDPAAYKVKIVRSGNQPAG